MVGHGWRSCSDQDGDRDPDGGNGEADPCHALCLAMAALVAAVITIAVGIGLIESLLARFAFRRVPLLLTTAFLFCLFALLAAWKGAGA